MTFWGLSGHSWARSLCRLTASTLLILSSVYLYIYFFVTWQSRNYSVLRWRCPGHLSYFERQCWTRMKKSSGCQLGEESGSEFFFPWLEDVFHTRQCELKPARGLVFTADCLLSLPEQHESGLRPEIWPWFFFIMCVLVISHLCCTNTQTCTNEMNDSALAGFPVYIKLSPPGLKSISAQGTAYPSIFSKSQEQKSLGAVDSFTKERLESLG